MKASTAKSLSATRIEITAAEGSRRTREGLSLDTETSAAVFERTGLVWRLDVFFGTELIDVRRS